MPQRATEACQKIDRKVIGLGAQGGGGVCKQMPYLASNVLPELLDARHKFGPVQEVHGHAIEEACVAGSRGQADVQLVQVVLAGISPAALLDLARLRQSCSKLLNMKAR